MVCAKITKWVTGARSTNWRPDTNLKTIKGVVQRDGKYLVGLKHQLMRTLWPHYTFQKATRGRDYGLTADDGLVIEKQIDEWCRKCHVVDGRYVKLAKDPRRKEARVVCGILVALGWTRVASQQPVAYKHIGTRLDYVFRTPTGKQVLVELKTGHNSGLRRSQGKLHIFNEFTNNRMQHALFQLAWTWAAVRERRIQLEPYLMMVNANAKSKFSTQDTVRDIAHQVQKSGYGRILTPLPPRHRAIAKKLLRVV